MFVSIQGAFRYDQALRSASGIWRRVVPCTGWELCSEWWQLAGSWFRCHMMPRSLALPLSSSIFAPPNLFFFFFAFIKLVPVGFSFSVICKSESQIKQEVTIKRHWRGAWLEEEWGQRGLSYTSSPLIFMEILPFHSWGSGVPEGLKPLSKSHS